jgi:hypothetical protein
MPNYLLRVRDRKNEVLLDRWTECHDTAEALGEAQGTIRSLVRRNGFKIDPLGRVDVEDQGRRPVARLFISEELKIL